MDPRGQGCSARRMHAVRHFYASVLDAGESIKPRSLGYG